MSHTDKHDEVRLELGHLRAGAIVRLGGMPFRIKTAVEVESHVDNFNAVLDDENVSGVTPRLAIGAIPSSIALSAVQHLIHQVENGESFDRSVMLKALRSIPSASGDINAIHQFLGPNSGLTVRDVAAVLDAANKVRP